MTIDGMGSVWDKDPGTPARGQKAVAPSAMVLGITLRFGVEVFVTPR
jgi:hypothetical protein